MPSTSINKGKIKEKKPFFPPQTRVFPPLKMFFFIVFFNLTQAGPM